MRNQESLPPCMAVRDEGQMKQSVNHAPKGGSYYGLQKQHLG